MWAAHWLVNQAECERLLRKACVEARVRPDVTGASDATCSAATAVAVSSNHPHAIQPITDVDTVQPPNGKRAKTATATATAADDAASESGMLISEHKHKHASPASFVVEDTASSTGTGASKVPTPKKSAPQKAAPAAKRKRNAPAAKKGKQKQKQAPKKKKGAKKKQPDSDDDFINDNAGGGDDDDEWVP